MKKLNNIIAMMLVSAVAVTGLSGCGKNETAAGNVELIETEVTSEAELKQTEEGQTEDKLNVVATIFPEYDFLRQIGGDAINLSMLVTPGAETHSFEPTPKDIKEVNEADMFVYVGGDSDGWVDSILDSVDTDSVRIVTLMDCVSLVEEETVEGMTPESEDEEDTSVEPEAVAGTEKEEPEAAEESEEPEYDEHVWTSPKNAKLIVQKLCDNLCQLDKTHAEEFKKNTEDYLAKLDALDQEFKDVVDHAKRKEIIVGDRFPFRYFVDEYGLTYYAAFPGCSADTEASAQTIAFLTDKVKNDGIPVVFHIELSNAKVCDSICEATGAKGELLNAVHNVSKDDFLNGTTYLDLMEHNVEVLKEALN